MRGDPAAVGHPALLDGHRPPVAQLDHLRYRPVVHHAFDHVAHIFVDRLADVEAVGDTALHDRAEGRAGLGQFLGQTVHFGIGRVADHEFVLAIEHAQALGHIVEGGIEAQVLHLELAFLLDQLLLLGFQALQRTVESGEREALKAVVGRQSQDQECKRRLHGAEENLARADSYMEIAVEHGGVDLGLCPELRPPGCLPLKHQRAAGGVGHPACRDGAFGALRRVQNVHRSLREPIDGFLPGKLHLDVAGADRCLLQSVLPELVGADPCVESRRRQDGDASDGGAQAADKSPWRNNALAHAHVQVGRASRHGCAKLCCSCARSAPSATRKYCAYAPAPACAILQRGA